MALGALVTRVLRILPIAAVLALALQPGGVPGIRPVPPAAATSGGCSPSSSTCYLFDVHLGSGPGVGTGFGTYRTIDGNGTYTGRIVCHYGNEKQTGICGWGYQVPAPLSPQAVVFSVLPDPGSQACQGSTCHTDEFQGLFNELQGNYLDSSWSFELINHVQVDVEVKGKGSGTVTSDPPGIECPSDCDDLFPAGYPVTLTAKAAAGSVFAGWSGDCTGTERTCEFGPVELTSVTATFNKKATPPPVTEEPATDEPTDEPTEEPPPEPTDEVVGPTTDPTVAASTPGETAAATILTSAAPGPTAVPSPAGDAGGSNLPLVIGLALAVVVLGAGAVFVARRPSG